MTDPKVTVSSTAPVLEVRKLNCAFGGRSILNDITFKVQTGETLVIMGGSGCGKSTLLRLLVGLLKPDSGDVEILGQNITSLGETEMNRIRHKMGLLFQSGALFNSMTVGDNIAMPILESSSVNASIAELVVKMKLELVGLTGFENLKPAQLSGGMKKRVGLARALALDPFLLFCDEPTAGLDPVMTAVIDTLVSDLTKKLGMTAIVVTHDMTSAFRIASRMIMLYQGRIVAEGTPGQIRESSDPVVQQFIHGHADGPIPLRLSKDDYVKRLLE